MVNRRSHCPLSCPPGWAEETPCWHVWCVHASLQTSCARSFLSTFGEQISSSFPGFRPGSHHPCSRKVEKPLEGSVTEAWLGVRAVLPAEIPNLPRNRGEVTCSYPHSQVFLLCYFFSQNFTSASQHLSSISEDGLWNWPHCTVLQTFLRESNYLSGVCFVQCWPASEHSLHSCAFLNLIFLYLRTNCGPDGVFWVCLETGCNFSS